MQLSVSGKHIDVGDSLRGHVSRSLTETIERHFGNAIEAKVTFSRERHLFCADISVHIARGLMVQSHAEASDAYAAFDLAGERLETRLQRYKGRLIDRRRESAAIEERTESAQHFVLSAETGAAEDPAQGQPAIIAELPGEIATLTVGEAVMRMDLGDLPVLMFRNRAHGQLNVVYRRNDGTVGWIDPQPAVVPSNNAA